MCSGIMNFASVGGESKHCSALLVESLSYHNWIKVQTQLDTLESVEDDTNTLLRIDIVPDLSCSPSPRLQMKRLAGPYCILSTILLIVYTGRVPGA